MNVSKIRINGARVLVKEFKYEDKMSSGIIVSGRSKQQTNQGTVVAVGDGAILENGTRVPMRVKEGDRVIYSAFSGSPIKEKADDPEEYLILNERDILCIIED